MNTLPSRHKHCHFNLTVSPLYLAKLKVAQNGRPLTAVHSVEPIVPIRCLLENSCTSLLTDLCSHGFYQKFIFKLSMVNFSM